jgi:hypothetical protein
MLAPLRLEPIGPVLDEVGCPEVHPNDLRRLAAVWRFCFCVDVPRREVKRFGHGAMLRCRSCFAETFLWWQLLPEERALWSDDGR